ncbi:hypothetical protein ACHAXT_010618 [Thalassiosira profunda]
MELVGWDEVLCRPIYRRSAPAAAAPKAKKSGAGGKVKVRKGGGDGPTSLVATTTATSKISMGGGPRAKKEAGRRRKARTISLSPVQGAEMTAEGGSQHLASSTISVARDGTAPAPARRGATNFVNAKKRTRGYGTKSSAPGNAAGASFVDSWGAHEHDADDEFALAPANKCTTLLVDTSPSLNGEMGEEMDLESVDGVESTCSVLDSGGNYSPTPRNVGSSPESDAANHSPGEGSNRSPGEGSGADSPASSRDAAPSFSPSSNISCGSFGQDGGASDQWEQSLAMHFDDGSISGEANSNVVATLSGERIQQPTPASLAASVDSPHTVGTLDATALRCESVNATASRESSKCTPFSKGEESARSPYVCGRRENDAEDDFDFAFDVAESEAVQQKQNRRSYGDVKPVWMPSKPAAAPAGAAQSAKVGCDDVLGRPIYHAPPVQAPVAGDSPGTSTASVNEKALVPEIDAGGAEGSSGNNNKRARRKQRAYTSMVNRKGLSQAARDSMDIGSPVQPPSPPPRVETSDKEPDEADEEKDANQNGKAEMEMDGAELDLDLEMEDIANDCNAQQPQPTSKSSLESARAFFRYLDTNHNLTILKNGDATPSAKLDNIRTNRRIGHNEQLRGEYSHYCQTVAGTGVNPISLSEFARNWNLCFTQNGVVRDGLLDEE